MQQDLYSKYASSERVISRSDYGYIYISPHLDDVALSCSGTICQQKNQGLNILGVTVFAGDPRPPYSPFVQAFHRAWQASEIAPYQIRKDEERTAMTTLGVDYAWFDWLEILYREQELVDGSEMFCEPGDWAIHPHDALLFETFRSWLADLHQAYPHAQIVTPLSLGGHRDHRLLFCAALSVLNHRHLLFYEDFPYATYQEEELTELVKFYHLVSDEVDISSYLEQRIRVAECYPSQLPAIYFSSDTFLDLIRAYTSKLGREKRFVERYWRLPA